MGFRLWAFGFALAIAAALPRAAAPLQRFEFSERQMGTLARLVLVSPGDRAAGEAAAKAFARIAALDLVMSDYRDDSEVMALCRRAATGPIRVSDDLFRVLAAAQEIARASDRAFDVTAGPLTRLWRRARRLSALPEEDRLRAALALVGDRYMILDRRARTVDLRKAGMLLDLGGIGKGFAAEEAAAVLKRSGIDDALVAIGGDIVALGAPPGAAGWTIALPDLTGAGDATRSITLRNTAVSTSGDAEQWVEIGGIRYSHVLDPRTGAPVTGFSSVTVIAPRGERADGLATAVSVLGPDAGLALLAKMDGVAALVSRREDAALRTATTANWNAVARPR